MASHRPSRTGLQAAWEVAGGQPLAAGKSALGVLQAYLPTLITAYRQSPAENEG